MAEKGIVGRGILIDFHSWRLAQSPPIPYNPFESGSIPLSQLLAIAASQGTEIKFGDILIIRSGYLAAQNAKTGEDLSALKDVNPPAFSGVEQSEEMLKWIWDSFSAVAGDQPSFECWRTYIYSQFNAFVEMERRGSAMLTMRSNSAIILVT